MEEIVAKRKKILKHRTTTKGPMAPVVPKEKTLYEVYEGWRSEQYAAMKDALDSAFGENYEIVEWPSNLTDFLELEKHSTKENEAVIARLLDLSETSGPIGGLRRAQAYRITIHFPKLVVEGGGSNRKHPIKDMWVQITLSPAFCAASVSSGAYMRGERTTVTYAEMTSEYGFSHMEGGWRPGRFRNFCLGHTPYAFLCSDLYNTWDKNKFLGFCFQIEGYLSWESASGGPYRSINDIRERSLGTSEGNCGSSGITLIYKDILATESTVPTIVVKTPQLWSILVKRDDEFEEIVARAVTRVNRSWLQIWDPVSKSKRNTGTSGKQEYIDTIRKEYERTVLFQFKGAPVKFVVDEEETEFNNDVPMRAPDDIVNSIENLLNQKFLENIKQQYARK